MARRVLLAEWTSPTTVAARLAARSDDSTIAMLVYIDVDLETGLFGVPTIWCCNADEAGERCRILGGRSRHTDVTADHLQPAFTAFNVGGQEGLMTYLEGAL